MQLGNLVARSHRISEGVLELLLEEDVEIGFELVSLILGHWTGSHLFLELLNSKAEDSLLEAVPQIEILGALSEFSQKTLSSRFSNKILLSLGDEGSLGLDEI